MTITKYLIRTYGIGHTRLRHVCKHLGINHKVSVNKLNNNIKNKISRFIINNYLIGDRLKKSTQQNVIKKVRLKSYKGRRLSNRLPARGQRTRTNAKTQKRILHYYGKTSKKNKL